jgi:aminopeptidase N
MSATSQKIRLVDYTPPPFFVDKVVLEFRLHPTQTRVSSTVHFKPNPDFPAAQLQLDGEKLKFISAKINGQPVEPVFTDVGLTVDVPAGAFIWQCDVEIDPSSNTALEGLYMSNGMYCTQCEAQGFRKITYYPDRPDVMAPFDVRIEGDTRVLLSNGNQTLAQNGEAEWTDPWPKPAYLFALVAGDLVSFDDSFTTASGKNVALKIWVRDGDLDKCAYAMDALKRSMKWDEDEYGREYDLDIFQIVAVDDFNMGAMENKGLNIFNSKYVLASPETATDRDFDLIEGIVAHEYFHNWTGNRITCRDWFQLSLKEGLTVFRDQQFSADMRGAAVKRIEEVSQLRDRQFSEDAGPLSHPVQPQEYEEINNFYTATIYEKGAEVVSMLHTLVGPDGYRKALDLYFQRHDGQACTIEDWLRVFEDATGRDLGQFKRWYLQSGTPTVVVDEYFRNKEYRVKFSQSVPSQPSAKPAVIPIKLGLLAETGEEIAESQIFELTQGAQELSFGTFETKPVLSVLRGFSAPVNMTFERPSSELALLLGHDTDPFNKWEAGRSLSKSALIAMIGDNAEPDPAYIDAVTRVLDDRDLLPAYVALILALPAQDDLAASLYQADIVPNPDRIYACLEQMRQALAENLAPKLDGKISELTVPGAYDPNAEDAGKRTLGASLLQLKTRLDGGTHAWELFGTSDNMTTQWGALTALAKTPHRSAALAAFYDQWQNERLVIDKWFMLQPASASPHNAVEIVDDLSRHADFDVKNPNRFRSLIAGFASGNSAGFHRKDGAGYRFVADWLITLDDINPQTTARMCSVFQTWRRYDIDRQQLMNEALRRIADKPNLSSDVNEMTTRILAQ